MTENPINQESIDVLFPGNKEILTIKGKFEKWADEIENQAGKPVTVGQMRNMIRASLAVMWAGLLGGAVAADAGKLPTEMVAMFNGVIPTVFFGTVGAMFINERKLTPEQLGRPVFQKKEGPSVPMYWGETETKVVAGFMRSVANKL